MTKGQADEHEPSSDNVRQQPPFWGVLGALKLSTFSRQFRFYPGEP